MSKSKYAFVAPLVIVSLALSACGSNTRVYRDTSELEQPPHLETIATQSDSTTTASSESTTETQAEPTTETQSASEEKTHSGLGEAVKLVDESHLIIQYPFAESWKLMKKALNISKMEISDQNHDKGQYYVEFDPDTAELKNGETQSFLNSMFINDDYPKARYLLTLTEKAQTVEVKAEFLEVTQSNHPSQDEANHAPAPDKGVEKLLKKLYSALHDDLPLS